MMHAISVKGTKFRLAERMGLQSMKNTRMATPL
jgi:hypothetical protein